MGSKYQVFFNGSPADDAFHNAISSIEVEENADMPDAIEINLIVNRTTGGELDWPQDKRVKPFANVAVVAQAGDGVEQCIFDGYVLSHKVHLETGTTGSTLRIWGQDASWLMNLEEKVHEWTDLGDADVADNIFNTYGFTPSDANSADSSPTHTEDGHTLMQRGSDIQFLRSLARRTGKLCRVFCTEQPGDYTGYFAKPALDGEPVLTLNMNDLESANVSSLDVEWDATRPTHVLAGQGLFTSDDPDAANTDVSESGLTLLDDRGLADFTGKTMTVLLAAPVDDAGELRMRAQALLREAGWFARCEGVADVARCGAVMRAGTVVAVEQIGSLLSGKHLVWSVRHSITADSHLMRFALVRNAVGDSGGGIDGLSLGSLGAIA